MMWIGEASSMRQSKVPSNPNRMFFFKLVGGRKYPDDVLPRTVSKKPTALGSLSYYVRVACNAWRDAGRHRKSGSGGS
jgi:hypothetical protein